MTPANNNAATTTTDPPGLFVSSHRSAQNAPLGINYTWPKSTRQYNNKTVLFIDKKRVAGSSCEN
jgi:hypothetical protein